MISNTLEIGVLEARHAIRVLLILRRSGPMVRSDLYDEVAKGMGTAMARVNELLEVGLLEEHVLDKPPRSKTIRLSAKGAVIAEHLAAIETLLAG